MYIDCHSHVLPGIDDGAKTNEESFEMLTLLKTQDVGTVFATPHFYSAKQDIEGFLYNRDKAYQKISNQPELPNVLLGAEVYYTKGISNSSDIKKLTINKSKYIMVEMPYGKFGDREIQEIDDLYYNLQLIPIIAHVERCFAFTSADSVERLMELPNLICQFNADSIVEKRSRRKVLKIINTSARCILGSDTHNMTTRISHYAQAVAILKSKLDLSVLEQLQQTAEMIKNNQ